MIEPPVTFAGLQFAPGPLCYNGTNYEIKDSWNYSSYGTAYGKTAGSTYFTFVEMGELFEGEDFSYEGDFSEESANIENLLNPFNGWRLPTNSEWKAILGYTYTYVYPEDVDPMDAEPERVITWTRSGSNVNGQSGKHYAYVRLSGVSHAGDSNPYGLLLFPDGKIIVGQTLTAMDDELTESTTLTLSQLNEYLEQGCVFLPASGYADSNMDRWRNGGVDGYYTSSTYNEDCYGLVFRNSSLDISTFLIYDYGCLATRLVK